MTYNRLILPYRYVRLLEEYLQFLWGYQITLCEIMRTVLYAVQSNNHGYIIESHFDEIAETIGELLYSTQNSEDNADQLMALDFSENIDDVRAKFMYCANRLMKTCETLFLDMRHIDAIVDAYIDDDGIYLLTTRHHKPPISSLM